MPRLKKNEIEKELEEVGQEGQEKSEKEELLVLYELMQKYAIHSISDVEVKLNRF